MDFSQIPIHGWIVICIICLLFFIFVNKWLTRGKKIRLPFMEIKDEDEDKNKNVANNSKNVIQGSTINGNVDYNFYASQSQSNLRKKHIYELCIKVLKFSLEHDNMVDAKNLKEICGSYEDAVYQMIDNEQVFHRVSGQRDVGIGKMKTDNIKKLITKYENELSNYQNK